METFCRNEFRDDYNKERKVRRSMMNANTACSRYLMSNRLILYADECFPRIKCHSLDSIQLANILSIWMLYLLIIIDTNIIVRNG